MRPRGFWSAAAIFGTIFGVGIPLAFWILGQATKTPGTFGSLEFVFMAVLIGVPAGLGFGYFAGPTTRTFNVEFSQDFRARLEASLGSFHYQLHRETPVQLTYRVPPLHGGLLPLTSEITIEKGASPVRVSGPRNMLGRLEKSLKTTSAGPGGTSHNVVG